MAIEHPSDYHGFSIDFPLQSWIFQCFPGDYHGFSNVCNGFFHGFSIAMFDSQRVDRVSTLVREAALTTHFVPEGRNSTCIYTGRLYQFSNIAA